MVREVAAFAIGLQWSHQRVKTLEAELETALHKMGGISDRNVGNLSKVKWSRSSRTDKGVHSLGTVGRLC